MVSDQDFLMLIMLAMIKIFVSFSVLLSLTFWSANIYLLAGQDTFDSKLIRGLQTIKIVKENWFTVTIFILYHNPVQESNPVSVQIR